MGYFILTITDKENKHDENFNVVKQFECSSQIYASSMKKTGSLIKLYLQAKSH